MKIYNLVFGMDGVLVHTEEAFIENTAKKLSKHIPWKFIHPDLAEELGIKNEQLYALFDDFAVSKELASLEAENNCRKVLDYLKKTFDVEFFIATARNKKIAEKATKKWVSKNLNIIPQENIYLTEYQNFYPVETKAEIFKRVQGDVFVEDTYKNAFDVTFKNPKALVLLYRREQNMQFGAVDMLPNMDIVDSWIKIKLSIENFIKKK